MPLVPLALIALSGCSGSDPAPLDDAPLAVRAVAAQAPAPTLSRTLLGELRGCRDAALSARAGGVVVRRGAQVGDAVSAGQVLLALDAREARANLRAAEAGLRDATLTHAEIGRKLERLEALGDAASEADLDAARTGHLRAEAAVDAAEARRDLAAVHASYMSVTAPFDGELAALSPELGETVGPGMPVARVVDTGAICLDAALFEDEVEAARDPRSRFTIPELEATLRLVSVSGAADPRTRAWAAELQADAGAGLLPGRQVSVRAELAAPEAEAQVPVSSIRDGGEIWLVEGAPGALTRRDVRVVAERGDAALVVGVSPGELVVVQGPWELAEGLEVRALEGP